jgi:hypothetical protein
MKLHCAYNIIRQESRRQSLMQFGIPDKDGWTEVFCGRNTVFIYIY